MEVEANSATNPKTSPADKDKINMHTIQETCRPVNKNTQMNGPGWTS